MTKQRYISPSTEVIKLRPEVILVSRSTESRDPGNQDQGPGTGGGNNDDAGAKKVNPWGSWDE